MNARDEVLSRIRAAHAAAPPAAPAYEEIVQRDYRTTTDHDHEARVELLVDRLVDYRALVRRTLAGGPGRDDRDGAGRAWRPVGGRPAGSGPGLAGAESRSRCATTARTD